jgi:hypothetical protein
MTRLATISVGDGKSTAKAATSRLAVQILQLLDPSCRIATNSRNHLYEQQATSYKHVTYHAQAETYLK